MIRPKSGFTLIELLVVVSIVSLMSSIVLSAVNSARTRTADNAVKAGLRQLASQTENYRDTAQNFSGTVPVDASPTCTEGVFNEARISQIKTNILTNSASGATFTCFWDTTTGTKWAISVSALKGGGSWCVDNSSGFRATIALSTGLCQ